MENWDFDFGEQGKIQKLFQGNKGTCTPPHPPPSSLNPREGLYIRKLHFLDSIDETVSSNPFTDWDYSGAVCFVLTITV